MPCCYLTIMPWANRAHWRPVDFEVDEQVRVCKRAELRALITAYRTRLLLAGVDLADPPVHWR